MTAGPAGLPRASPQLPCQCPPSTPMAGSGCAWGAEPPRFLEAFGRLWQVQSRLGSGSSASVYRVRCCGTPGSPPGALKQFLPPGTTGAAASAAEYGFRKERAALEQLQGHRNIGNCRCLPSLLARVPAQPYTPSQPGVPSPALKAGDVGLALVVTRSRPLSHPPSLCSRVELVVCFAPCHVIDAQLSSVLHRRMPHLLA